MELHCESIICGGPEFNYSSEGAESTPPFFSVVYPPLNPPPIDGPFNATGCLYLCASYISQEDADLCALRQAILCDNPEDIWFSAPATCAAPCPDGGVFYYTVPAGMFIARTYDEALNQAQAYACAQAQLQRFCIGALPRCACVGNVYSGTVGVDVAHSALTWTVIGSLPPGLDIISNEDTATIVGTPALLGTYAFQLVATDANGNYAIKTFTIQVIQVTTTSLPDFTIGVAYSYQLTADGGSGNYNWTIITGTLPDGIDLSSTGLLSGTPTISAAGSSVTFGVVDVTCETIQNPNNPPRVSLVTSSTTIIRTKRGWPVYDGSSDSLYKRLDVSGSFKQTASTAPLDTPLSPGGEFCAGAIYSYDGFSQIDNYGNFTSRHTKVLSKACINEDPLIRTVALTPEGTFFLTIADGITTLLGYCWEDDPESCDICVADQTSWIGAGNFGTTSSLDFPSNMIRDDTTNATITATSWSYVGDYAVLTKVITGVTGFPEGFATEAILYFGAWVSVGSEGSFSFTLSEEFTDADAIASQQLYHSNGKVSENKPDYRTWTTSNIINRSSRTTSVTYALNFTNLIIGEDYVAAVDYWSSTGSRVTIPFAFTAIATTHVIGGAVPTPAANTTITVKNPRVLFAS